VITHCDLRFPVTQNLADLPIRRQCWQRLWCQQNPCKIYAITGAFTGTHVQYARGGKRLKQKCTFELQSEVRSRTLHCSIIRKYSSLLASIPLLRKESRLLTWRDVCVCTWSCTQTVEHWVGGRILCSFAKLRKVTNCNVKVCPYAGPSVHPYELGSRWLEHREVPC